MSKQQLPSLELAVNWSHEQVLEVIENTRKMPVTESNHAALRARKALTDTNHPDWHTAVTQAVNLSRRVAYGRRLANTGYYSTVMLQVAFEEYTIGGLARDLISEDDFWLIVFPVASQLCPSLIPGELLERLARIPSTRPRRRPVAPPAAHELPKPPPRASGRSRTRTPATGSSAATPKPAPVEKKKTMTKEELDEWF